jgi:hypothetical protein
MAADDKINPAHYKSSTGLEAIDVIEAFDLDYPLGTAVKYILRAGKKPDTPLEEDINKAIWFLKRKIRKAEAGKVLRKMAGERLLREPDAGDGWN